MFNDAISVTQHVARIEAKDEQVKELLAQKGTFSDSATFVVQESEMMELL